MDSTLKSVIDDVTVTAPWDLVLEFSEMPRWKPEDVAKGAKSIADRLRSFGVPVTLHQPELYLSIPFSAEVKTELGTMRAKPPAYSRDCRDGLEAELVYVPAQVSTSINTLFVKSNDDDMSSAERVRGKIVVSEGFSFPGKIMEMESKGAVGVIAINPGVDAHWGICTSIWGTPDLDDLPRKPTIPVAAVSNPDGLRLIELAERGGKATLFTEMEEGWYTSPLPEVIIPGTEEPEKFVLLHGHYDSWDVGVGDNATGDATMLECARVLWNNRDKLKRSIRICWWPGHSTGRYAGSTWYADAHAIELDENCVAQVNCDSPGCRWATIFKDISWTSETENYCQDTIRAVTGLESHGERPHRAGDYAFNNIGLSSFFMLSSTMPDELRAEKNYYVVGGCGGNIAWHTENDILEIADKDILERDIKVYLAAVMGVANSEILPFDWRATMVEFRDTIQQYQNAAGDAFDLSPSGQAVDELDVALSTFYTSGIEPSRKNAVIQGLARVLIPINFTVTPRFRHDPALPVSPLPTIEPATSLSSHSADTIGFAKTQLTRGQNRLVAALRDARRMVENA